MRTAIAFLNMINRVIGSIVCWCALLMVLLQFSIVLLRYVFGISYVFLNEGVLYLHASLFMLGAGYTFLVDGHVRVDIYYADRSARGKALTDIFGHLLFLFPSMAMLAYFSWPTVLASWRILEGPVSVGGIPASFYLKSLITAFCGLLIIQGIAKIISDIIVLNTGIRIGHRP
ncbi:MAG: TRAP transporter small permease subunit [Desulfobacterales bacterium]|nr:TRAP transporter small permease subunit [Desulfobacterales bacterium]